MNAEELRRYYSELKKEDDENDERFTEYIKQFIRKVWSYR